MSSRVRATQLSSVRSDGSRVPIHPADVRGRFIFRRRVVFALLIGVYASAPFVPINGRPAVRLDVAKREFYLLGAVFNAQDVWLVSLLAVTFVLGLLFVTAWRGRLWCGWACPQTVFLEAVFRPIERLIDGPRERRLRRAREGWSWAYLPRAAVKHAAYLLAAWCLSHVALALFASASTVKQMLIDGPLAHRAAFGWSMAATGLLYFNFAWFREQLCVVLCPYGRMQSALHDGDSIVIAYDKARGEPRGKLSKGSARSAEARGDCVDCFKCVQACPTAIDIRDGLQMECIACAQCIDACDEVMDKIRKPRGLIRYASSNALLGQPSPRVRPRLVFYGALTALALLILVTSLRSRGSFEANLIRYRGVPYVLEGDRVRNQLEVHLVNKRAEPSVFDITHRSALSNLEVFGEKQHLELGPLEHRKIPIVLTLPREQLQAGLTVELTVTRQGGESRALSIPFVGPPGGPRRP